jgi:L-ribulose-5-phosphate 3-epimerase
MGGAAMFAPFEIARAAAPLQQPSPRIKLAVSTYSYWHFRTAKYPVEQVIEDAARLGFDASRSSTAR